MLFNYTTHFLVLYYFSSSSPTKVRGVREELKLFLFYFFISTFYISLKKIRMLEILSHSSHFLPFLSPKRRREIGKTQPSFFDFSPHFQINPPSRLQEIFVIFDVQKIKRIRYGQLDA